MFKVGDKIVYGTNGLFVIDDIRDENVLGKTHTYYVLKSASAKSDSLSFIPTDNEELVSHMRAPMSKSEAELFIKTIPDIEPAPWIGDSRKRAELYRELLESGKHSNIVAVIKSVKQNSEKRIAEGKKAFVSDENTLKRAKDILLCELCESLNACESEIEAYIL